MKAKLTDLIPGKGFCDVVARHYDREESREKALFLNQITQLESSLDELKSVVYTLAIGVINVGYAYGTIFLLSR